jgi:2-(1,2-epoxy-1,2-dihydrophenyl)acetyl-CoA isomerase
VSTSWVHYDVLDAVATVRIDRPEVLNAIDPSRMPDLLDALRRADGDDTVRAVVLTGTGRAFCTGADLRAAHEWMAAQARGEAEPDPRRVLLAPLNRWNEAMQLMRGYTKPLIAAVNGLAVGGGLLFACAADIRIAAESARFSAIFAKRGMAFEAATSYYLPRLVGIERTFRMVYTADMYSATEALAMGLVGEVVPDEALPGAAAALAGRIASMPTLALGFARRQILKGMSVDDPDISMMMEVQALAQLMQGPDYEEGWRSFIEKRSPRFSGR